MEQRLGAQIVNYADDLVICCKGDSAQKALNAMRQMMGRLKLTVNEEKTRICRVPDGEFDFLGYTFGRRYSAKTGRPYIASRPSRKSIKRMTEAVRIQTGRNMEWLDAGELSSVSESETWRVGQLLQPWSKGYTCIPIPRQVHHKPASPMVLQKHQTAWQGFTHYPDEYLYQKLGLIRLPMLPQKLPWAKA